MSRGIFLIQNDGKLIEMREQAYESEDLLQHLLANYPGLLAGDQIDRNQPRRWLLIKREAGIPAQEDSGGRWSVDHLFLDQDAVPTLVEVKRSSDTRIRREVVGQMLDYAANAVVYWPVDHLRAEFEAHCLARGLDPEQEVSGWLGPENDSSAFWQQAKTNLQAGRVRLVFIADEIPAELRRIVEFLNQQMDPAEVLAIEIKQYTAEGLRTLVPSVVGQTAGAQQRKGPPVSKRRQWDEGSFFEEVSARHSPAEVSVVRGILEWARPRVSRIWWGKGQRTGSFVPVFQHNGTDHQLFAVYTYGSVELYFQWYRTRPPFDAEEMRLELIDRLNQIPGVSIPADAITRRPSIPFSTLATEQGTERFLEVFDWFLREVQAT
jgi:hypothetical protein